MPLVAAAAEIVPFESTNQSPLVQIYGLPGTGNAVLLPQGRTEVGLNVALSNNYTVNENSREHIILDGETTRFTVAARYGLFPRMEIGVKIPYISHNGGFLDGFIESYHGIFGFPNGGAIRRRKIVFSIVTGATVSRKSASILPAPASAIYY